MATVLEQPTKKPVKLPAIIELPGKKVGMTQYFTEDGKALPVTALQVGPAYVLQVIKKGEKGKRGNVHSHSALRVGFDPLANEKKVSRFRQDMAVKKEIEELVNRFNNSKDPKEREALEKQIHDKKKSVVRVGKWNKADLGLFIKTNVVPTHLVQEVAWDGTGDYKAGDVLSVSIFKEIVHVDIIGTSKGRGFTGVVKRWGFHGSPATHGDTDRERAPGSLGRQGSISRNVIKGKKMAGHYGAGRVTTKFLEVIKIFENDGIMLVRGAVPGPNGGYVTVRATPKGAKVMPITKEAKVIIKRGK